MGRAGSSIGAALLVWVAASDANAFCRSTACRATTKHECPKDADGCVTEGAKLWWPTSCISYAANQLGTQDLDPADTRQVIKKSFQAWTDVACPGGGVASMTFQEIDPVPCKRAEYNKEGPNLNVILFQDDDWKYKSVDATLAKTSVTYNDETGEIYDADIEVNTAFNTVTVTDDPRNVQYDLQSILTHEVGHFIGLAHSPDPGAVMFASYSPGSMEQRRLSPDDIAAVCAVYPPNNGVACKAIPRGGLSTTCDPPSSPLGCAVVQSPDEGPACAALLPVLGMVAFSFARRLRQRGGERRGGKR